MTNPRLSKVSESRFAANDDSNFGQLEAIVLLANFANLFILNVLIEAAKLNLVAAGANLDTTSLGERVD